MQIITSLKNSYPSTLLFPPILGNLVLIEISRRISESAVERWAPKNETRKQLTQFLCTATLIIAGNFLGSVLLRDSFNVVRTLAFVTLGVAYQYFFILKRENKKLVNELADLRAKPCSKESCKDTKRFEELEDQLALKSSALTTKIGELDAARSTKTKEIDELKEKLAVLEAALKEKSDTDRSNSPRANLLASVTGLMAEAGRSLDSISADGLDDETERLQQELQAAQARCSTLEEELKNNQEAQRELAALKENEGEKQKRLETLQQAHDSLKSSLSTAESELTRLQQENNRLTTTLSERELKIDQDRAEFNALKDDQARTQMQLQLSQRAHDAVNQQLIETQQRSEELQKELAALNGSYEEARNELARIQGEKDSLNTSFAEQQTQLATLQRQHDELEREHVELGDHLVTSVIDGIGIAGRLLTDVGNNSLNRVPPSPQKPPKAAQPGEVAEKPSPPRAPTPGLPRERPPPMMMIFVMAMAAF